MENFGAVQRFLLVTLLTAGAMLIGCANGPSSPPPQPLSITGQPLSQTVPLGTTATFQVTASGSGTLSYQWSENGVPISGATASSYTTPDVALGPDGSTQIGTFQVAVSNGASSVTSKSATLTAGPRSPKQGDLRYLLFQQVDVPGLLAGSGTGNVQVSPSQIISDSYTNTLGSPVGMGSLQSCQGGACVWPYGYQLLPSPVTGFTMYYQGGDYSNFVSDLNSFKAPNVVLTSLDIEPTQNAYATSWVKTSQTGGFDYRMDPLISPGAEQVAQIQAQSVLDGTESRVITAVSFDASDNAILISYGWTGDTTTVYQDQAYYVAPGSNVSANVLAATTMMANAGYVISAFGGNDTDGYILIGMRVEGDSLPRSIDDRYIDQPPYFTNIVYLNEFGATTIVNEQ